MIKYKTLRYFLLIIFVGFYGFTIAQPRNLPAPYVNPYQNFVRSFEIEKPIINEADAISSSRELAEVKQVTQYFDGLGRLVQTVAKKGSFVTGKPPTDLVSMNTYDEFGRQQFQYLPFQANPTGGNTSLYDGQFKLNPYQQQEKFYQIQQPGETYYYGQTNFEPSPLSRVQETFAPGNNWVGSSNSTNPADQHSVQIKHWTNTESDYVAMWGTINSSTNGDFGTYEFEGFYQGGDLHKEVTVDEHAHQVIEFIDFEGKLILKKVQIGNNIDDGGGMGYDGWLCTYYIYDQLNNLRCVIQPKGVELISSSNSWNLIYDPIILDEQCFRYEYDSKNRMIIKKNPGSKEIYMVYDKWDRLILTQDGNLRNYNSWIFTKYDYLNRPIITGIFKWQVQDQPEMQSDVDLFCLSSKRFESLDINSDLGYTNGATFPTYNIVTFLTITHYDDYEWTHHYDTKYQQKDNSYDALLLTPNDNSFPYPQALTTSNSTMGMVTGTISYILNLGDKRLINVIFYDEKGRIIQTKSDNITRGFDINTTQYSFSGQTLINALHQENGNESTVQKLFILTTMVYDDLGRLLEIKKAIKHDDPSGQDHGEERVIVQNSYDELGQLRTKRLEPLSNGSCLEYLNYQYNIRGWLTSINKDFVKSPAEYPNYFGMELSYDNPVAGEGPSYLHANFNGNIAGISWASKGDKTTRRYDFSYDNTNRLLKGDFIQKNNDGSWNHDIVNYDCIMGDDGSDYRTAYDGNGNILKMKQWGFKLSGSDIIDDLTYTYLNNGSSNKLKNVIDLQNDFDSKLGDFKTLQSHPQYPKTQYSDPNDVIDYGYDDNGNLIGDNNKGIESIEYNYLNLPQKIEFGPKGAIGYIYDALGNKLQKQTTDKSDPTKTITITTTYVGGATFQSKQTEFTLSGTPPDPSDYTDQLQFVSHEEGRIRPLVVNSSGGTLGNPPASFAFDYFIKDHLGNIRSVITDEVPTVPIYKATMEDASYPVESRLFINIPDPSDTKPSGFDSDNGNNKVQKLFSVGGTSDSKRIGAGILLKVMAGDKFSANVFGWYQPSGTNPLPPLTSVNILNDLVNAFSGGLLTGYAHNFPNGVPSESILNLPVQDFLTHQSDNATPGIPKGYLNWIVLDEEQFKMVEGNCNSVQIPQISGTMGKQVMQANNGDDIEILKNGYLYVYVSNESSGNVYFDDLVVKLKKGPLLEETHYYPFGLTMKNISSSAPQNADISFKYNGKELENNEFKDGSGIELYDYGWRNYDPQIGRFLSRDPMGSDFKSLSPYNYAFNNPINVIDPTGASGEPVINGTTITIYSTLWIYGGAANQERATAIATAIQNQWNAAAGKIKIGDVEYDVVFAVQGVYVADQSVNLLVDGKSSHKLSAKDNFVRVEENGADSWNGNSGFINWTNFEMTKTHAAHEFGHGLNWFDEAQKNHTDGGYNGHHDFIGNVVNGERIPGIMTPSKNLFYNDMVDPTRVLVGPLLPVDRNHFLTDKQRTLDPDCRKVTQRDINLIMRGYVPNVTKSIGTKNDVLYNSKGQQNLRRLP